ncbi:hypothetical protein SDC9_119501 [bioreactor metagenome]|uniref:Uncharacterized protein n=1 Tax=bioreactor metagenome TaxID=1076179 RepID=A0A645C4P3_9ZZZZ
MGGRDDALDAEEERGVAADNFSIRESANITNIRIGHGACIHQLFELHASDDAGHVAGLKGMRECVFEVRQLAQRGAVARHGDEGHVRILGGSLLHVGLMAIAVGEDIGAALLDEVDRGVIALFIFGDVVLPDDAVGGDAGCFCGGFDTVDVRCIIARVLVMNEDNADFHSGGYRFFGGGFRRFGGGRFGGGGFRFSCGRGCGAGDHSEHHRQDCQKSNDLFHGFPPTEF